MFKNKLQVRLQNILNTEEVFCLGLHVYGYPLQIDLCLIFFVLSVGWVEW